MLESLETEKIFHNFKKMEYLLSVQTVIALEVLEDSYKKIFFFL